MACRACLDVVTAFGLWMPFSVVAGYWRFRSPCYPLLQSGSISPIPATSPCRWRQHGPLKLGTLPQNYMAS
jgi:hypothetical protein